MNYNPQRDIPKAIRELRTTSPTQIAEWVRRNRTEKTATGKKQQKAISPQAITMWLKRHPKIAQALEQEVSKQEIEKHAVSQDLFVNGTFRQIPIIKKWEGKLTAREAKPQAINNMFSAIRMICQGILPRTHEQVKTSQPVKTIEGWGLVHPHDLTLDKALAYLIELRKVTTHTRRFRIALRNFLKCLGIDDWDDISGKAESEEGKYAHMYVPPDKINQIFEGIARHPHPKHYEALKASKFSFKTACRITATLNANAKYFFQQGGLQFIYVFEKASRGKPKRKLKKFIPQALYNILPKQGDLFDIKPQVLTRILRDVYKQVIPDLEKELKTPFHFWRHMFAQHMLRKTNWQTARVAKMGGWTTEALERYYGKMGDQVAWDSKDVEDLFK